MSWRPFGKDGFCDSVLDDLDQQELCKLVRIGKPIRHQNRLCYASGGGLLFGSALGRCLPDQPNGTLAGWFGGWRYSELTVVSASHCSFRYPLQPKNRFAGSDLGKGCWFASCPVSFGAQTRGTNECKKRVWGNGSGHGQRGSASGCMQIEDSLERERSGGLEKQHALVVHVDLVAVLHKVKRIQRRCDVQERQNIRQLLNIAVAQLQRTSRKTSNCSEPHLEDWSRP